jgi:hypothetical protein
MHFSKVIGIFLCLVGLCSFAAAKENKLRIHEVSRVTFEAKVHIGDAVLPAGEYVIRHEMEGQEHVMVFQRSHQKDQFFKVRCTLVALPKRADQDQAIYETNASNERVLRELVFSGDRSKHVF